MKNVSNLLINEMYVESKKKNNKWKDYILNCLLKQLKKKKKTFIYCTAFDY